MDLKTELERLDVEMRKVLMEIATQYERVEDPESRIALKEMLIDDFKETLTLITLAADSLCEDEGFDPAKLN